MNRRLILPLLAVASFTFMGWHIARTHQPDPPRPPMSAPPQSPHPERIAGVGLIESRDENVDVAAPLPGVIIEVCVTEGQRVEAGQLLFRIDDRAQRADVQVREAELAASRAELERLRKLPRPEDIPPSQAKIAKARADLVAQQDQLRRGEELFRKRVMNEEDVVSRRQAVAAARELLAQAEAEHARLMAGAWKHELAVAAAQVARAEQLVAQAQVELSRLEVRAPAAANVLKVDVHCGEYVGTPPGATLILLGNLDRLHVRVDLDEQDLPRFQPGTAGTAFVRGDSQTPLALSFVRVEPYVAPKKSLSGTAQERTDTRVLQVIYALPPDQAGLYVGQQVDVFLDASDA